MGGTVVLMLYDHLDFVQKISVNKGQLYFLAVLTHAYIAMYHIISM